MEIKKLKSIMDKCYKFNIFMNLLLIIGVIIFIIKEVELTYFLMLFLSFIITFFNILFLKKEINSIYSKKKDRFLQQKQRRL